jgi:formate/nitrite transporter
MSAIKSSAETMEAVCDDGLAKSELPLLGNLIRAFMAGAFIGFGAILALKCAAGMPPATWGSVQRLVFGGVFPVGLLLVLFTGADLFTGDCMLMPSAVWRHNLSIGKFFRVLFLAYAGNLVGGLVLAWLTSYSGALSDSDSAIYSVGVANGKCALGFGTALVRGVLCNWLVCLAIYMALTSSDAISKAALLWPPIMAFVALGFEHSIANMVFIPLGIWLGAGDAYAALAGAPPLTATWRGFFIDNLIPVTLGNFIGGAFFAGLLLYKSNGLKATAAASALSPAAPSPPQAS